MAVMTLSQARENFLSALETLRNNKVRSALTVIGIIMTALGLFQPHLLHLH